MVHIKKFDNFVNEGWKGRQYFDFTALEDSNQDERRKGCTYLVSDNMGFTREEDKWSFAVYVRDTREEKRLKDLCWDCGFMRFKGGDCMYDFGKCEVKGYGRTLTLNEFERELNRIENRCPDRVSRCYDRRRMGESRSTRGGRMLNEGYSVNFLRKLVHRIVGSKTNNEYFSFYGKKIELQSGTENYVDVCIDDNIHFSIDYDTNEVNFESIGQEDEKFVEDISDALHKELDGRFGKVQISFDDNISYEDDTPSQWYYLSNDDKRVLRTMTSNPEDIKEIAELTDNEKIEFRDNKGVLISADDAFERLGQEQFLSGLLRATYHWSCARGEGQNEVTFRLKRKGE